MAGVTSPLNFPYPTGTDRVMDGDNAMQALAEAVDNYLTNAAHDDTGWQTPTFVNSWIQYGGAYQNLRYRRMTGVVHVLGAVKSGTLGAAVFTLPAGYRPGGTLSFPGADGTFEISTAGVVAFYGAANTIARCAATFPADA